MDTLDCKWWGMDPEDIPPEAYCLPCADDETGFEAADPLMDAPYQDPEWVSLQLPGEVIMNNGND